MYSEQHPGRPAGDGPPARARGFTLIELLVVVGIIAVLTGILFPVLGRARGAARKAAAVSHLKQIGVALAMYTADYDEHLPNRTPIPEWPGYNIILFSDTQRSFKNLLSPYTHNEGIWYSPEDRLPRRGSSSFAVNLQLAFSWSLAAIPQPASAIYMTDRTDLDTLDPGEEPSDTYVWWMFPNPDILDGHKQLPCPVDDVDVAVQISPRRYVGDVAAYLFLDGHVQTLAFARTWGDAKTNMHYPFKG